MLLGMNDVVLLNVIVVNVSHIVLLDVIYLLGNKARLNSTATQVLP